VVPLVFKTIVRAERLSKVTREVTLHVRVFVIVLTLNTLRRSELITVHSDGSDAKLFPWCSRGNSLIVCDDLGDPRQFFPACV
jgi:hypothetical protein